MRRLSLLCVSAAILLTSCSSGPGFDPTDGDILLNVSPTGEDSISFYFVPDQSRDSAHERAEDIASAADLDVGEIESDLIHDDSLLRVRVEAGIDERVAFLEHRIPAGVTSEVAGDGRILVDVPAFGHVTSSRRLLEQNPFERTYEATSTGSVTYEYSKTRMGVTLGALLLVFILMRIASALFVRRVRRSSAEPVEKAHRIQRLTIVTMLVLPLALIGGVMWGGLLQIPPILLGEVFPSLPSVAGPLLYIGTILLVLMPLFLAILGPIQSYYRELRDLDQSPAESRRKLIRGFVFGMAVPLVWITGLTLMDTSELSGWLRGFLTIGLFIAILILGPVALAKAFGTAKLDPQLRERLISFVRSHGVKVRDIRTLKGRSEKHANALMAGVVPGFKYIFLTDYLVDEMDDEELTAIVAHEIGHAKKRHLLIKLGVVFAAMAVVGGLVVLLTVLHVLPDAVVPFMFMALPVAMIASMVLLQGLVGLRLEHAADDFAKQTVGLEATVRGLEKLAELNMAKRNTGRVFNLLSQHPSIEERVERLRREEEMVA